MALPGIAPALVLGLIVRALPRFPPVIAHLGRVVRGHPLPAMPVGLPGLRVVVVHVAAVMNSVVLLRCPAVRVLVTAVLAATGAILPGLADPVTADTATAPAPSECAGCPLVGRGQAVYGIEGRVAEPGLEAVVIPGVGTAVA